MRIWRLEYRRTRRRVVVKWLGPVRTYTLLVWLIVKDRANW